jgi:hypothetical protein
MPGVENGGLALEASPARSNASTPPTMIAVDEHALLAALFLAGCVGVPAWVI